MIRSMMLTTLLLFCLSACVDAVEVDHPFYVAFVPDSSERALYRCTNGPDRGCAIDGLPGPDVIAAGANEKFVVEERKISSGSETRIRYYYFERIPNEARGYGMPPGPERIIGPLTEEEFESVSERLLLPPMSVTFER